MIDTPHEPALAAGVEVPRTMFRAPPKCPTGCIAAMVGVQGFRGSGVQASIAALLIPDGGEAACSRLSPILSA
jgi:hypothetical protein